MIGNTPTATVGRRSDVTVQRHAHRRAQGRGARCWRAALQGQGADADNAARMEGAVRLPAAGIAAARRSALGRLLLLPPGSSWQDGG